MPKINLKLKMKDSKKSNFMELQLEISGSKSDSDISSP